MVDPSGVTPYRRYHVPELRNKSRVLANALQKRPTLYKHSIPRSFLGNLNSHITETEGVFHRRPSFLPTRRMLRLTQTHG